MMLNNKNKNKRKNLYEFLIINTENRFMLFGIEKKHHNFHIQNAFKRG